MLIRSFSSQGPAHSLGVRIQVRPGAMSAHVRDDSLSLALARARLRLSGTACVLCELPSRPSRGWWARRGLGAGIFFLWPPVVRLRSCNATARNTIAQSMG